MRPLSKTLRRLLAGTRTCSVLVLAALVASSSVFAAVGPQSEVTLTIVDGGLGYPINGAARFPGRTISIEAAIDWLGGLVFDADVYVGVLEPKSDNVWTWAVSDVDGKARLVPGMVPILEDVPLREPLHIKPAAIVKSPLTYTFTGNEQPGMYLVFFTVVKAGSDPGANNGVRIRMEPLFVIDPP